MNLESVSFELKTIRRLFEQVDPVDISGTLEKYGIILCLFDLIMRRVREERDPRNYNEMFNGKSLSLPYFEEKLGLFMQRRREAIWKKCSISLHLSSKSGVQNCTSFTPFRGSSYALAICTTFSAGVTGLFCQYR
jgi:hypothetical protein